MGQLLPELLVAVGLGAMLLAAGADLKARVIPNGLVLLVVAVGLLARLASDGWAAWESVLAALAVFVPLAVLCELNVLGGGDVKMTAAATLLTPAGKTLVLLAAIAIAGGVLAVLYLAASHSLKAVQRGRFPPSRPDERPGLIGAEAARIVAGEPMPYGVAILAGALFAVLHEAL